MFDPRYTTIVTGAAGDLGRRLLPQLREFSLHAVDLHPPDCAVSLRFEPMDLGREACCRQLVDLLRATGAANVVHLAFVADPAACQGDPQRMWQINVAGTARVMEAITEVNRMGGAVRKFIFPSSAWAYGSDISFPVKEDMPLTAHPLPCALHHQEADEVAQLRAHSLGACATYILRPQVYAGAGIDNFLLRAFRGIPPGPGRIARRLRRQGKRVPIVIPRGPHALAQPLQFVHPDDVARLIAFILRRAERSPELHILNVAGRGPSLSLRRCAEISGARLRQTAAPFLRRWAMRLAWRFGVSPIPPEVLPYLIAPATLDTARLRAFLGGDYEQVMQHTIEEAFAAAFVTDDAPAPLPDTEKHDSEKPARENSLTAD